MSAKSNFQEILDEIRKDLLFLRRDMLSELQCKVNNEAGSVPLYTDKTFFSVFTLSDDTRQWILDVFLDKFFEVNTRIIQIVDRQLGTKIKLPIDLVKQAGQDLAFHRYFGINSVTNSLEKLRNAIEDYYCSNIECQMSSIRLELHNKGWAQVKKINSSDYVLPIERATYVTSRQELEKAKQAVKDKQWDEVLNHLRPAVDLALKEKFGFKRIQPMKSFIGDAEKFDFKLPSYTMLYDIFDEGTKRIHEGKLNTPYECQKALEFVAGFIDRLDLINVTQQQIDEFKERCKFVE